MRALTRLTRLTRLGLVRPIMIDPPDRAGPHTDDIGGYIPVPSRAGIIKGFAG